MSSDEDDYYRSRNSRRYEPRPSNRPRRRNSASSRRRTHRAHAAHSPKSRRPRTWLNNHAARLMAACVFMTLIGYEVFILKPPLFTDANDALFKSRTDNTSIKSSTSTTVSTTQPVSAGPVTGTQQSTNVGPPIPLQEASGPSLSLSPSRAISVNAGKVPTVRSAAEIPADEDAESPAKKTPPSPAPIPSTGESFHPLKRRNFKHDAASSSTPVQMVPGSALRLDVSEKGSKISLKSNHELTGSPSDTSLPASSSSSGSSTSPETDPKSPTSDEKEVNAKPPLSDDGNSSDASKGADPGAGENFWNWFQETKGSEKEGVSGAVKCPEESKRLCTMFYKIVRKYKIRSIYDISCVKNLDWMPEILKKVGGELWGFKYFCSAPAEEDMATAKSKLSSLAFVEFIGDQWWRKGFSQNPELLFAWDTLPHIAYGRVWNFFVKAKTQKIKYILVDNYPSIANDPSPKREYINLRRHPFRFPAAKEVVQNVTEVGDTEKRQLLFYESTMLPENLQ